jgi:peptide/nickel transport system permease protein
VAMPEFWLGLVLLLTLSGGLGWLPSTGWVAWNHGAMSPLERAVDHARHLALPCAAMALPALAWVARHQRAALLEVLDADFIRTAKALHIGPRRVLFRHALPASLAPILTLAGVSLPALISGSVVVETLFNWPGMGRLLVQSILDRDSPVVLACFLLYALAVVAGSLLADLGAAAIDPRVRDGVER